MCGSEVLLLFYFLNADGPTHVAYSFATLILNPCAPGSCLNRPNVK